MGEFLVHHIRFFDYEPQAVQALAYEENTDRVALSRSDGSVEVWSVADDWYQEKVIPPIDDGSIEAIIWCQGTLYSAGLHGNIVQYDLVSLKPEYVRSCNGGAVWCLAKNEQETSLVAGTEDGAVVLFELTNEGPVYTKCLDRQDGRILSIAWSSDGDQLVTGGIDNIRIWNVRTGHAVQRLTLGRQEKNKETLVWSVAVLDDMTIISGDSRGKTCFWNGKHGTLLKGFTSHKADVLCICINKAKNKVYSSGIDSTLVEFEYIASQPDSDWKMWVKSSTRIQHTHDVRAIVCAGDYIVSGGVDCNLIINRMETDAGPKYWRRLSILPESQLVHVAEDADIVALQYGDYIELHKLGSTLKQSGGADGDMLPLHDHPVKLLQLKSRGGERIVCSAICPSGSYLAYSDSETVRLYQIVLADHNAAIPHVAVNKVTFSNRVKAGHAITFDPSGSKVIVSCSDGSIQVLGLEDVQGIVLHTFEKEESVQSTSHLLSVSSDGKYLATANHNSDVNVYHLKKYKLVCSLPKYEHQPTALAFNPATCELIVAYTDQKIFEYSVSKKGYTEWSRSLSKNYNRQWLRRHSKIKTISFNPRKPENICLQDDQTIAVIDKTQPFPSPSTQIFKTHFLSKMSQSLVPTDHCFHICQKFKYVMFGSIVKDNLMVIVECSPLSLTEKLPPTLKKKKFGT